LTIFNTLFKLKYQFKVTSVPAISFKILQISTYFRTRWAAPHQVGWSLHLGEQFCIFNAQFLYFVNIRNKETGGLSEMAKSQIDWLIRTKLGFSENNIKKRQIFLSYWMKANHFVLRNITQIKYLFCGISFQEFIRFCKHNY
jgi:hypothetical protein